MVLAVLSVNYVLHHNKAYVLGGMVVGRGGGGGGRCFHKVGSDTEQK